MSGFLDAKSAVARAYAEYVSGKRMHELAAEYGVTRQAVGMAFKRAGLPVRPRGRIPMVGATKRKTLPA